MYEAFQRVVAMCREREEKGSGARAVCGGPETRAMCVMVAGGCQAHGQHGMSVPTEFLQS